LVFGVIIAPFFAGLLIWALLLGFAIIGNTILTDHYTDTSDYYETDEAEVPDNIGDPD
jgi:hypothetical protein